MTVEHAKLNTAPSREKFAEASAGPVGGLDDSTSGSRALR